MTPLHLWVPGTPRPKGSLRSFGKGRMVEQVTGSGDWRAAVANAAHEAITELLPGWPAPTILQRSLLDGYPLTCAVKVSILLRFAPPKSWKGFTRPTSVRTGDADKHARNILDALQDAGVYKNDAQVVSLTVYKHYCRGEHQIPGADITVTEAPE